MQRRTGFPSMPADDWAPENPDEFATAAVELSERHSVEAGDPRPLAAWRELRSMRLWLAEARAVCAKPPPEVVKAAEWLLDNDRQIERTLRQVDRDLPSAFYRRLPRLAGSEDAGLPRACAIAYGLLRTSHLQVSLHGTIRFVSAYQERADLTIAELWAFPTMLRLACLEILLAAFARLVPELEAAFSALAFRHGADRARQQRVRRAVDRQPRDPLGHPVEGFLRPHQQG